MKSLRFTIWEADYGKGKGYSRKEGVASFIIDPDATLYQALEIMADKNIGAIIVVDTDEKVLGIFSERDFVRKSIIKGRSGEETKVGEIMTTQVLYVEPETPIPDCMTLMTEKKIRHLPVMSKGKLVGLISIGDVVKAFCARQNSIISQQDFQIGQLEQPCIIGMPSAATLFAIPNARKNPFCGRDSFKSSFQF